MVIEVKPLPLTSEGLKEDGYRIRQIRYSKRYRDMEDDGGTCRGETISTFLIQQFPECRDMLIERFE